MPECPDCQRLREALESVVKRLETAAEDESDGERWGLLFGARELRALAAPSPAECRNCLGVNRESCVFCSRPTSSPAAPQEK